MCQYVKFRFSYTLCSGANRKGCGAVVEKSVSKCTTAFLCTIKQTYVVKVRDQLSGYCPRCASKRWIKVEDPLKEWKRTLMYSRVDYRKLIKDLERCAISGEGIEEVWKDFESGDKYARGDWCCVVS